jgi:hypothetical protein
MLSAGPARADANRALKLSGAVLVATGGAAAVVGIGLVSSVEAQRPDGVAQPLFCINGSCPSAGVNYGELYDGAGLIVGGTLLAAAGMALIVVAVRRERAHLSVPPLTARAGGLAFGLRF